MIGTSFSHVFSDKILFPGKRAILGLKMGCLHNFVSALRSFLKFCKMKGVKKYMEIILMFFSEKSSHLRQMGHFDPKNGESS